jgi:tocopherol O-methyltransferase
MNSDSFAFDSPLQHRGFELLRPQISPADSRKISAAAVRRHYEVMSLPYRLFWGEHLHHGLFLTGCENPYQAQIQLLEFCSRLLKIRPGSRVLDVGCGYGATAIYLACNLRCSVDGLTLSPKQARVARTKIRRAGVVSRVAIEVGDAERFQLNGQYDLIWMMESSEHLEDKATFMCKAARLLRDRGKLLITAWTASDAHPLVRELARLTVCPGFQTAEDYAKQLCRAGLDITGVIDCSQNVLPSWEISYRRVTRMRLLWPLMPAEIRSFLCAIPLMIEAYRRGLMSYKVLIAEKGCRPAPLNSSG